VNALLALKWDKSMQGDETGVIAAMRPMGLV